MKNFYHSVSEMSEDLEQQKKQAKKELEESIKNYKNERKRKFFIFILIIVLIKLLWGIIHINSPFTYNKNRLYEIYVNDNLLTVNSTDHFKVTIIPGLVDFNAYNTTMYYGNDNNDPYKVDPLQDRYVLKVNSYVCYSRNSELQLRCDSENDNLLKKKASDVIYTNLYIKKNGKPEVVMYNGPFISDISKYIKENGTYYVRITSKYKNVENYTSFPIWNKK